MSLKKFLRNSLVAYVLASSGTVEAKKSSKKASRNAAKKGGMPNIPGMDSPEMQEMMKKIKEDPMKALEDMQQMLKGMPGMEKLGESLGAGLGGKKGGKKSGGSDKLGGLKNILDSLEEAGKSGELPKLGAEDAEELQKKMKDMGLPDNLEDMDLDKMMKDLDPEKLKESIKSMGLGGSEEDALPGTDEL